MKTERFSFTGNAGQAPSARLDAPDGTPAAYALFAHCFTCGKDSIAASRIARALVEHRIAVLRFDFTGIGGSGGDFGNSDFSANLDDLVAAADHLRENFEAPEILIGHSLGGAAILACAARIPEAGAVATIAAPFKPSHVSNLFSDHLPEIEADGCKEVKLASGRFLVRQTFLDDLERHDPADYIGKLGKALLVMHTPLDEIVGIESASSIFQAARHPKSFVSLDGADHLLTKSADAAYCADVLAAWASRYVDLKDRDAAAEGSAPEGIVTVAETGRGKFQQRIQAGAHALIADEPESVGGLNTGPTPYDLLLSALGTCTAMTIRMYADRKSIALDHVAVSLTHRKIHAEDCAACETQSGKIDSIERKVRLDGNFDREQLERLMEIADKCPVHRTLTSEIEIVTEQEE